MDVTYTSDLYVLELQEKIDNYELEVARMKAKLDSQAELLAQLQKAALEDTPETIVVVKPEDNKKRPKKMSTAFKQKRDFYHANKTNPEVIEQLTKIVPEGKKIPWQWIKQITDEMYEKAHADKSDPHA